MNQAAVDGALHAGAMLVGQLERGFDLDAKVADARSGILDLVGGDADVGAFGGELEFTEILRGIESSVRTERCEQELGRRHAFVEASVFLRLVAALPRYVRP